MTISTVIFDLGGVLVEYDFNAELSAVQALCSTPALELEDYKGLQGIEDLFIGRTDHQTVRGRLIERGGFRDDRPAFLRALTQGFGEAVAGIEPVVDALRGSYQLALLSNTQSVHWEYALSRYGFLLNKLTLHFVSFEIGLAKPDEAIFRHVTKELGVTPGECIFVDDYPPNVEGARKAGLDAVHFTGSAQLVRDLADRGIDASGA